jgi:lipopolysaccharide/colanic/teichoic acid biosynthesis glycosyltransferase
VERKKAVVLASGTCNGIDVERYQPTVENVARAEELRHGLDLPTDVPVIGFVGRFTRDKGIPELMDAYEELRGEYPALRLLLVGDFEDGDSVPRSVRLRIENDQRVIRTGFVPDTAPYYHLLDVLVLPTFREGFPGTPLEAQAAGKPVVTTKATGAVDSVQDGKTGLVVPVGDALALARAIRSLLNNPTKRAEMGRRGQEWIKRDFAGERVRAALVQEYKDLIRENLGPTGRRGPQRGCGGMVKRVVDVMCAGAGLVVVSPVLALTALLIRMTMGGPVFFKQIRPGRYGRAFTMLKFRTMNDARDSEGHLLGDRERLTKLGCVLRACSVDELPQLWNVVRGEMSLVGPRPLLMEYLSRYTPEQARRHEVLPGVTGWAQMNGRNALSWQEKFSMDIWYVDNWSLALDLRILFSTMLRVLRRDGISQSGQATMSEFLGNEHESVKQ